MELGGNTGRMDAGDLALEGFELGTPCFDFFRLFWCFLFLCLLCLEDSSELLELELDELLVELSLELSELELLEYFLCFFLDFAMFVRVTNNEISMK